MISIAVATFCFGFGFLAFRFLVWIPTNDTLGNLLLTLPGLVYPPNLAFEALKRQFSLFVLFRWDALEMHLVEIQPISQELFFLFLRFQEESDHFRRTLSLTAMYPFDSAIGEILE